MHKQSAQPTLAQFSLWAGAESQLGAAAGREMIRFVSNDSRSIGKGDIFVAIKTEKDDGHRYVADALAKGASAALVAAKTVTQFTKAQQKKLIVAPNPLRALQRAAARYRRELGVLIIGITGSSGKTTTRNFIMETLGSRIPVAGTVGNWNNHIGVPMSLLRFTGNELAGVIEMGSNHLREIHDLSLISRPDIAVITNIGYAHIGMFGSLKGTTKAKFEIADGLDKKAGFMLLNGDDKRLVAEAKSRKIRSYFYGFGANCDVRAGDLSFPDSHTMRFSVNGQQFTLAMPGRHFVYAALAAIFCGRRCGMDDKSIAKALACVKPVSLRGTIEKKTGVQFIVDCYNANPSSMESALQLFEDIVPPKNRVAVIGDMLELGPFSPALHKKLGQQLAGSRPRASVIVGEYSKTVADAAIKKGLPAKSIITVDGSGEALDALRTVAKRGDTVLLKASRGIKLETVFENF